MASVAPRRNKFAFVSAVVLWGTVIGVRVPSSDSGTAAATPTRSPAEEKAPLAHRLALRYDSPMVGDKPKEVQNTFSRVMQTQQRREFPLIEPAPSPMPTPLPTLGGMEVPENFTTRPPTRLPTPVPTLAPTFLYTLAPAPEVPVTLMGLTLVESLRKKFKFSTRLLMLQKDNKTLAIDDIICDHMNIPIVQLNVDNGEWLNIDVNFVNISFICQGVWKLTNKIDGTMEDIGAITITMKPRAAIRVSSYGETKVGSVPGFGIKNATDILGPNLGVRVFDDFLVDDCNLDWEPLISFDKEAPKQWFASVQEWFPQFVEEGVCLIVNETLTLDYLRGFPVFNEFTHPFALPPKFPSGELICSWRQLKTTTNIYENTREINFGIIGLSCGARRGPLSPELIEFEAVDERLSERFSVDQVSCETKLNLFKAALLTKFHTEEIKSELEQMLTMIVPSFCSGLVSMLGVPVIALAETPLQSLQVNMTE
eukprot:TRINITY_DN14677_c0_g3_i1.p1 TRINITY_DN14677_c0_g3~~TRINITY_DN14677_c0_g3_i1.p1  ORF type:complete len:498 (+),score=94.47 TRINITY_DN14677_c0_g3_i1:51-1496(+)